MNLLLKSLIVVGIGCSMAQISAMQGKKLVGKKPGQSGNIGSFLKAKYCPQPTAVQVKSAKKAEKLAEKAEAGK